MPSIIAELDGDLERILKHFSGRPFVLFDSNVLIDALVDYSIVCLKKQDKESKENIVQDIDKLKARISHSNNLIRNIREISKKNMIVVPDFVRSEMEYAILNLVDIDYKKKVDSWLRDNMGPYCADVGTFNKEICNQTRFKRGKNRKERKKVPSRPKSKPTFMYLKTPFSGTLLSKAPVYSTLLNNHIIGQTYLKDPQLAEAYSTFFESREITDCALFHTAVYLADRLGRKVRLVTNDRHFNGAKQALSPVKTFARSISNSFPLNEMLGIEPPEDDCRFIGNKLSICDSERASLKLLE